MATSPSERQQPQRPQGAPPPSPEELAAIMAAVDAVWPRPAADSAPLVPSPWRFSNRWWMPRRGIAADRARP